MNRTSWIVDDVQSQQLKEQGQRNGSTTNLKRNTYHHRHKKTTFCLLSFVLFHKKRKNGQNDNDGKIGRVKR